MKKEQKTAAATQTWLAVAYPARESVNASANGNVHGSHLDVANANGICDEVRGPTVLQ
jgi:hypothetical protein